MKEKKLEQKKAEDKIRQEKLDAMDDDEREPFQIKLTPEQHEEWWVVYGRWLEEEIDLLEKALNLSNDFKRKKLKQLWFEYEQTSKTKFLNKLKAA